MTFKTQKNPFLTISGLITILTFDLNILIQSQLREHQLNLTFSYICF